MRAVLLGFAICVLEVKDFVECMLKINKCHKLLAKLLKLLWGYIYISKECRDFDIDSGNIFSVNDLYFQLEGVGVW